MGVTPAAVGKLIVETRIKGCVDKTWKALTRDITRWWPAEFYTGGVDGKRRYLLEDRVGGRMYEHWDEASGVLWATVNTVVPRKRLDVFGVAFPLWGGPSLWTGSWELTENEDDTHTTVRFTEASIGVVSADSLKDKDAGWRFLLDGALRAHVEGTPPPRWDGPVGCVT